MLSQSSTKGQRGSGSCATFEWIGNAKPTIPDETNVFARHRRHCLVDILLTHVFLQSV